MLQVIDYLYGCGVLSWLQYYKRWAPFHFWILYMRVVIEFIDCHKCNMKLGCYDCGAYGDVGYNICKGCGGKVGMNIKSGYWICGWRYQYVLIADQTHAMIIMVESIASTVGLVIFFLLELTILMDTGYAAKKYNLNAKILLSVQAWRIFYILYWLWKY